MPKNKAVIDNIDRGCHTSYYTYFKLQTSPEEGRQGSSEPLTICLTSPKKALKAALVATEQYKLTDFHTICLLWILFKFDLMSCLIVGMPTHILCLHKANCNEFLSIFISSTEKNSVVLHPSTSPHLRRDSCSHLGSTEPTQVMLTKKLHIFIVHCNCICK